MKSSVCTFSVTICFLTFSAKASFAAVPCVIKHFYFGDTESGYAVVNEDTNEFILGESILSNAQAKMQDSYDLFTELLATGQCVKTKKMATCEISNYKGYYHVQNNLAKNLSELHDENMDQTFLDFHVLVKTGQCSPKAIPKRCNIDARCGLDGFPYRIFSSEDNSLIFNLCYRQQSDVVSILSKLRTIGQCVSN